MLRRIVVSAVLVVLSLSAGTAGLFALIRTAPTAPSEEPAQVALPVRAIRVEPRTVVEPILGFGTARADRAAVLSSQVVGQVTALAEELRSGASVEEGEALVEIDDREYRALVDRARSQLAAAKVTLDRLEVETRNLARLEQIASQETAVAERELNRLRNLLEQGTSNPREVDQARLVFEQARRALATVRNEQALLPERRKEAEALIALRRAEVAAAALNVERCTVRAPFSGQLDEVRVELGQQVRPGEPLLTLADLELIEVPVELPVSLRSRIEVGAPIQLFLESEPDAVWEGRVARIGPMADPATRTFSLFAEVDNRRQPTPLVPGMFLRARIAGPTLRDVLIVPRGAIQQNRVYVARDGRARQSSVEIERLLIDEAVVDGLMPGTLVITSNLGSLADGVAVAPQVTAVSRETTPASRPAAPTAAVEPNAQTSVKTP